jgi:rubrerythrin
MVAMDKSKLESNQVYPVLWVKEWFICPMCNGVGFIELTEDIQEECPECMGEKGKWKEVKL